MWTTEITVIRDGKTSVHRVGPFVGLSAVIFWFAIKAFIATLLAMLTPYWSKLEHYHLGLWKICQDSLCEDIPSSSLYWFNWIQALMALSLIASACTLILASHYTLVGTYFALRSCFVATVLAAMLMLGCFAWFAAKTKDHFAYSFYLAVVAFVLHVVVAIAGGLQINISTA